MVSTADALLHLEGVRQVFPNGTVALRGVDLVVRRGSVHGLVGANGAGKSTLIKMLSGALQVTDGRVRWDSDEVRWSSPAAAIAAGVATIHQHIPLVPTLTVLENVFLHRRGWRRTGSGLHHELDALTTRVGYDVDPAALVSDLPIGERQMVAILQALAGGAALVVMDEPTSSLAAAERDVVFDVIRRLTAEGTTFIYVSHFLDEVLDLTDHITVLRDGRVVADAPTGSFDEERLVRAIVGRELMALEQAPPPEGPQTAAPVLLEARHLSSPSGLHDVSLAVREGEVVGIAGLLGAGRSELLHALFGADPSARGEVEVAGHRVARSTRAAVEAGVALVPEDRNAQGLVGTLPLSRNTSLPDLDRLSRGTFVLDEPRERRRAQQAISALGIVAAGPGADVTELSGGNAQKVVFAKWMFGDARVFLLDEPTVGVDVGAKVDILRLVTSFAAAGNAVVIVSSEFDELLAVASRVLVLRHGRLVADVKAHRTSEQELVLLASGLSGGRHAA